jgi:hypothetical protein
MEELIQKIHAQARQLGACALFTGEESSLKDICVLFRSAQGMEFCMKHHFPNISTLRLFKQYNPEQYGIYIDAGQITLTDPDKVVLIGNTTANINCRQLKGHNVYLLRGAKAVINATGWSVTNVQAEPGCKIIKNTSENAIIL